MSNFLLSPGITPALADLFVIAVPLAAGFGYLLWQRRGLEGAFALAALVLGGIKLYTDFPDLPDDVVAGSAILGGVLWGLLSTGAFRVGRGRWIPVAVLGGLIFIVGLIKLRDFYDPFDLLLADTTILAGVAIWLYARRGGSAAGDGADARPGGEKHPS